MSQAVPTPPDGSQYNDPRSAKAHAAAEKAYKKASRPWYKKKRFILPLLLVLLIILFSALSGGGGDDPADTAAPGASSPAEGASEEAPADAAPSEEAPADAAPAFPGAEDSDVVGQAGDTLTLGDITVSSSALVEGDATITPTLCTTVTVNNGSADTIDFSAFDWKLQSPGGTILNTGFSGSDNILSTGQIAPGGSTSGDLCFDSDTAETGQYVVLYEPIFSFFSDRGAWINNR